MKDKASQFFNDLGISVDRRWAEMDYNESAFPALAVDALREAISAESLSFRDTAVFGVHSPIPVHQDVDSSFGQPPLLVFEGRDFHIELLFWIDGLPTIHEHSFSGAFHVLSGSSLHAQWKFTSEHDKGSRLRLGNLEFVSSEVLETGAIRAIHAGSRLIHSTFHLERPSVTCVVRTNSEAGFKPQFAYLRPGIAFAADEKIPIVEKRKQLLGMYAHSGRWDEYLVEVQHALECSDTFMAFHLLWDVVLRVPEAAERESVLLSAVPKHHQLMQYAIPSFNEYERLSRIQKLRQGIANPDLQFFLALLLNLPSAESILASINVRYPHREVVETLLSWLRDLAVLLSMPSLVSSLVTESVKAVAIRTREEVAVSEGTENKPFDGEALWSLGEPLMLQCYWLLKPLFFA